MQSLSPIPKAETGLRPASSARSMFSASRTSRYGTRPVGQTACVAEFAHGVDDRPQARPMHSGTSSTMMRNLCIFVGVQVDGWWRVRATHQTRPPAINLSTFAGACFHAWDKAERKLDVDMSSKRDEIGVGHWCDYNLHHCGQIPIKQIKSILSWQHRKSGNMKMDAQDEIQIQIPGRYGLWMVF